MVFSLSALWWRKIMGLWKLPNGRDWLRGKLGLVLMGGATLSKSLIKFCWWGCVPSLLIDLKTNYGGGSEDAGDLLQRVPCRHCYPQCPQPCDRPPPTQPSERLLDTHRQVWVSLSRDRCSFLLGPGALLASVSPVLCKFWWLYGGLMATSSKRAYATPRPAAPRAPAPAVVHCWPGPHRRHLSTVLCQSLWGLSVLVCTGFVWTLWGSLVGMGFDSKHNFTPPTILLGLLLCP